MVSRVDAKDWAKANVKGLWTTPTIPFSQDFALDEAGIRKNVDYIVGVKAGGIGFGFSEPWVLSIAERKRAMEVAIDAVGGRICAYLHTTDHSVPETISLTKHAKAVGADAVMIWPPYEWAKNENMIYDFYKYVAENVDIAIFLYNTYHSGVAMSPELIARLTKLPNVCAVKDAINDATHTIRTQALVGNDAFVNDPLEEHLLTMSLHFSQRLLLGTTSVFLMQSPHYQPVQEYYDLAVAGKAAEATQKYYELEPLRNLWKEIYSVLWSKSQATHPLAYIKYWMDLIGMAGGPVRPPMHQLSEQQKADFKVRLQATGWLEKLIPKSKPGIAA